MPFEEFEEFADEFAAASLSMQPQQHDEELVGTGRVRRHSPPAARAIDAPMHPQVLDSRGQATPVAAARKMTLQFDQAPSLDSDDFEIEIEV